MVRHAWLLILFWVLCNTASGRDQPPNLLILIADDHAAYTLGVAGDNHNATPNLDRLARQGVWFSRAYCQAPVCTPSRQSFLTGRYPHTTGVTLLPTPLDPREITLADRLAAFGYLTAAIGKMHFNADRNHGFDIRIDTPDWRRWLVEESLRHGLAPPTRRPWRPFQTPAAIWLNAEHRSSGLSSDQEEATFFRNAAIAFLREHRDGPFALVVSFHEPHSPFVYPRQWEGRFQPDQFPVRSVTDRDRLEQPEIFAGLTPDQVRGIQAAYYTSLHYVDHQIGLILDTLQELDLDRNTIVIYLSDNGYALGHRGRFEKHTLYEESVRIPLIVRWSGQIRPRPIHALVELVDLVPTVLELMGLPTPPALPGQSLAGLIRGDPGATGRDLIFSEYLENEEAMVRTDRFKLIVGTGARHRQDGYQTGRPLPGPYQKLFDLEDDPGETVNLSGQPQYAALEARLRSRLHQILTTTQRSDYRLPAGLSELEAIHWCLVPYEVRSARPSAPTTRPAH
ncbi:MAG: iduronate-2-sulfatase [Isosphaeraceae bacterium]|jgi:choline-sulfatase|nr:MAG: iduronate-2-sulfatase [Isosphaeraceae bacterium]